MNLRRCLQCCGIRHPTSVIDINILLPFELLAEYQHLLIVSSFRSLALGFEMLCPV